MQLNLIPENVCNGYRRRARIRTWGIAFTLATVVLAIPVGWDWSRQAKARRLRVKHAELTATRSATQTEWEHVKREVAKTQAQIERADALRAKRAWSSMLALIARDVPPNVWLVSVATDPAVPPNQAARRVLSPNPAGEPDAASITIDAPSKISIVGFAPHAEDPITLVSNLKASGAFRDVTLRRSFLEPIDDGLYFRFDIVCEW